MSMRSPTQTKVELSSFTPVQTGLLQRKCASCGQHTIVGGECAQCQKKRSPLQRRATNQDELFQVPPIVHEVLNSPGQPLAPETRTFMEFRFGHDFSQVRVHTDAKAAESAQAVSALAYTVGRDVVFGAGKYTPNTTTGQKLLAHELVHTLQQQQADSNVPQQMQLASANTRYEQEATQIADIVTSNERPARTDIAHAPAPLLVQRTCGSAAISSVGGCSGRGGDITQFGLNSDHLYLFQAGCDDFQPGEEDRLRQFAATITPDETIETVKVEIDGFASEEGSPDFNESLSCARAHQAASILSSQGIASEYIHLYEHGATPGSREHRRSVIISANFFPIPREIQPDEQSLLDRLTKLGHVASKEGKSGAEFKKVIEEFRSTLKQRIEELNAGEPLPNDLQLIMKALLLWSRDPGNQWGEGIWDSNELIMSAPEYATVPASQYKCNAYVAQVLYQSLGIIQKIYEEEKFLKGKTGKYFSYRARDWGDANLDIPHFPVVQNPIMGDIWSNGSHTGIYLGTYAGKRLYISARDDGNGVFGLKAEVQKEHGIQIKYLQEGGVYRRYTP